jgi:radical SAM protein with 4Fe4S-binding SPASM domain
MRDIMPSHHKTHNNLPSERICLADYCPLDKPLIVHIDPTNMCNLSCEFCASANNPKKTHQTMSLEDYRRYIDSLSDRFGLIKALSFGISGEPTVNPQLPEMIAYATVKKVADRIDMFTNGVLLNERLADQLIASGLTHLRVSVNGLSSGEYKKRCGVKLDFQKYLKNLRYLFDRRCEMKIYVKIIDYMVPTTTSQYRFIDLFSPVSDFLGIQALIKSGCDIDWDSLAGGKLDTDHNMLGNKIPAVVKVCPHPFFTLSIMPNGDVYPCCRFTENTPTLGNLKTQTIAEIYKASLGFQKAMLTGREKLPGCNRCEHVRDIINSGKDYLDDAVPTLLARYETLPLF